MSRQYDKNIEIKLPATLSSLHSQRHPGCQVVTEVPDKYGVVHGGRRHFSPECWKGRECLKRPSCVVKWWWFPVSAHSATLLND